MSLFGGVRVPQRKALGQENRNRSDTKSCGKEWVQGCLPSSLLTAALQGRDPALLTASCRQRDLGHSSSTGHRTPGGNGLNIVSLTHSCHPERCLLPFLIQIFRQEIFSFWTGSGSSDIRPFHLVLHESRVFRKVYTSYNSSKGLAQLPSLPEHVIECLGDYWTSKGHY